jgi:hypothetical protein
VAVERLDEAVTAEQGESDQVLRFHQVVSNAVFLHLVEALRPPLGLSPFGSASLWF